MAKQIFGKIVAIVILTLLLGTTFTVTIQSKTDYENNQTRQLSIRSDKKPEGLVPPNTKPEPNLAVEKQSTTPHLFDSTKVSLDQENIAYAYLAYDPSGQNPEGFVYFYLDTPEVLYPIGGGVIPTFVTGADFLNESIMYMCIYDGGLYRMNIDTYEIIYIAPTISLNGLTYDSTANTWYAAASNNLYTIDIATGASTFIGPYGIPNTIIGLACDTDGIIYAYDVLFSGDSTLYSINKTTGAATAIGSMGIGFCYAQDPAYDRDNGILYLSGYTQQGTSGLYICDTTTAETMLVGPFPGGGELDGLAIPWCPYDYDHDIKISNIDKPASGNAGPITPIVKIKNTGLNTEIDVQIQLEIGKELITGIVEDFEATNGSYVHAPKLPQSDAWQWGAPTSGPGAAHSGSNVWTTNLAGNYPPNMWCYLLTPTFIVPSGAYFNFWHWYYFENNYDGGNVKITNDDGATWTIITPVGGYPGSLPNNPYMTGQAAYNGQSGGWKQANFDLSTYEGDDCQIMFECASDSSVQYTGWYIDDVGFTITSWENEYNQTITISVLFPDETLEVSFPEWTPADLGLVENVNINYNAEATNLFVDNNTNNDYKEKAFTLHYGFLHDVAVTEIVSPQNGLAQTQTPEVAIINKGQNVENVTVHMTIGKALYTTLLEEDFSGGVPPAGWGTNYPSNWMSSSTNYAGGTAPEAMFSWSPSSNDEHLLYTGEINTTGYTALLLKFKEYVHDYNSNYQLKIQTSTDGGATWTDAYVRAGGLYGPTTTEVALSTTHGVGSATLQIAWDMSGDSYNINYWYIDDAWLGLIDMVEEYNETVVIEIDAGQTLNVILPDWTPADIPFAETIDYLVTTNVSMNTSDGNPSDNELAKIITLRYEHDVGVIAITEPSGSRGADEAWLQYDNGVYANAFGSTTGQIYGANRFTIDELAEYIDWKLDMICWKHYGDGAFSGNVHIYSAGSATAPGAEITSEPFSISGDAWFEVPLSSPVTLDGSDIWLCVEGTHNTGEYPLECSEPGISLKSAFFSSDGTTWYDLPGLGYDVAFEIRGHLTSDGGGGEYWPPGTYPIEGIIKNFGVTFPESDIPVNTQVTNDTGVIVYDETVVIAGPIAPGGTALVTFPDIIIPEDYDAQGNYKLTMKTILPGDDHPSNDKKILTFIIYGHPGSPPITYATLSGTMGQNDWFVSNVTVTLSAWDEKWPEGVDYTMYKVDDGEWTVYETPFVVDPDGEHTVYFYSVDKAIPPNVEEEKSVSFKIDKTTPVINTFTVTAQNVLKTLWLLEADATDATSGVMIVQFYADDAYVGNDTTAPYEFLIESKIHTAQCIVYDMAGNSKMSDVVTSYDYGSQQQYYNSLQLLQQKKKTECILFLMI